MRCDYLLFIILLVMVLASPCFAGGSLCEFNLSCENVESMLIEKSYASLDDQGNVGELREVYVCALFLKNKKDKRFETMIRNCNDTHYIVRAGEHSIARPRISAVPIGEWFTFHEDTFEELMKKVNQICPNIDIEYGPEITKELHANN